MFLWLSVHVWRKVLKNRFFFYFMYIVRPVVAETHKFPFFALVTRQNAALSTATLHAMPRKFGGKWTTESFNTRFPLPALSGIQSEAKKIIIK